LVLSRPFKCFCSAVRMFCSSAAAIVIGIQSQVMGAKN